MALGITTASLNPLPLRKRLSEKEETRERKTKREKETKREFETVPDSHTAFLPHYQFLNYTQTPEQNVLSGPPYTPLSPVLPAGWSVRTEFPYHPPIPYSTPKPRATGPRFPSQSCGISRPQTLQPGVPAVKTRGAKPGQNDGPVTGRQAAEPRNNRRPLLTVHWGPLSSTPFKVKGYVTPLPHFSSLLSFVSWAVRFFLSFTQIPSPKWRLAGRSLLFILVPDLEVLFSFPWPSESFDKTEAF